MAVLVESGMKSNSWNSEWDAVDSTSTGPWSPGRVTKITFNRGFPMAVLAICTIPDMLVWPERNSTDRLVGK